LIRMAVGHYQFEAIHPFTDATVGRPHPQPAVPGRSRDCWSSDSVSEPRDHPPARRLLPSAERGHSTAGSRGWVYMLDACTDTATWTTKKIKAMRELLHRATTHVREEAPGIYSRELVSWSRPAIQPHRQPRLRGYREAPDRVGVSQGIV